MSRHVNQTDSTPTYEEYSGTVIWFVINVLLISVTVSGNLLTITAILITRKLRAILANQFVFSLAVSDLFVGLTIPYHMAFYVIPDFGLGKVNCLLRFVLISFACSSSISNLLVIAADRYVAIVYPLHYIRLITRKTAVSLTVFAWSLSFTVAAVPAFWNDWTDGVNCDIYQILPSNYVNFVICPMFGLIWLMMLLLYWRICREANGQAKRLKNAAALKDSKSFQVMLAILGCFTVCWLPYFVIAIYNRHCNRAKSGLYYEIVFNLAVANSGMNPIIYAWKNQNFRAAFLRLARCRSPNAHAYVTNHDRCPSISDKLSRH